MSELIDNRAFRIRTLKHIIKELHAGTAPEQVKGRLAELIRETDASEIAAMEQELMAEGMQVEEIKSMCDLHSQVLRDFIAERQERGAAPGHPVDTFRRENEAIRVVTSRMKAIIEEIDALPDDAQPDGVLDRLRGDFNELMDVDKHYLRKENVLFPYLEKHGITGPSKVMWAKDDEVREMLKALGEALQAGSASAAEWKMVAETLAVPALRAVEEMIFKEERILLPISLDALTEDEWGEVWRNSPQFGWCLVEPLEGYAPPDSVVPERTVELPRERAVQFPTGALTFEQLMGIFSVLPADLTFVDADDRVRYFSEGRERIFSRSRAVIGRKVQHCHPPRSIGAVQQIISDFRSGKQSVADFWINFRGRFVMIRYLAVRGQKGEYLGTLEVTQDLTRLRTLEGERRLLEYDAAEAQL
ncbi:MAG: DUF438 domain-containing protein [Acidobacteria bacterium]|nr:DUF438 domain-containing protein [Acidobacteriota bacterium]